MDIINSIVNAYQTNSDPLNFIGVLITVAVSIYIFKGETSLSYVQERHEKLIFPLFDALEPFLYQKQVPAELSDILAIIENNKYLADGKLLSIYYWLNKNPNVSNFLDLCTYIDKAYDKSCRKMNLKTRPISYKISRKQYRNILYIILYVLLFTILGFVAFILFLTIFFCAISLLYSAYSVSNGSTKMLCLLIFAIFGLAINKYLNQKS